LCRSTQSHEQRQTCGPSSKAFWKARRAPTDAAKTSHRIHIQNFNSWAVPRGGSAFGRADHSSGVRRLSPSCDLIVVYVFARAHTCANISADRSKYHRRMLLQVVIVSTRQARKGDAVASWFETRARAHGAFDIELVDLAEVNLPLFDEPE